MTEWLAINSCLNIKLFFSYDKCSRNEKANMYSFVHFTAYSAIMQHKVNNSFSPQGIAIFNKIISVFKNLNAYNWIRRMIDIVIS